MNRTRLKRPLCTEVLTPDFAKVFALSTAVVGTTTLFQFCGPVSALLGLTTVGLYNDADELLAVAKLSKPIIKSRSREALIKVKLDF